MEVQVTSLLLMRTQTPSVTTRFWSNLDLRASGTTTTWLFLRRRKLLDLPEETIMPATLSIFQAEVWIKLLSTIQKPQLPRVFKSLSWSIREIRFKLVAEVPPLLKRLIKLDVRQLRIIAPMEAVRLESIIEWYGVRQIHHQLHGLAIFHQFTRTWLSRQPIKFHGLDPAVVQTLKTLLALRQSL